MDVEVTNENNGTATSTSSFSSQRRSRSKDRNQHVQDKWKRGISVAQKDAEKFEGAVKSVEREVKEKVTPSKRRDAISLPPSPPVKGSESSGNDDDDEGWGSETSDSGQPLAGPSTDTSSSAKVEGKKRSRGFGIGRKGRQRVSLRRSLTPVHVSHHEGETDNGEESRGRSGATGASRTHPRVGAPHVGAGSSRPRTADSAINQRLESLRAQASRPPTREASPSRSVRFVDVSGDGGTLSARTSRIWGDMTPTSPRSPERPTSPGGIEKVESSASSSASLGGGRR